LVLRSLVASVLAVQLLVGSTALAHDPSAYGGLFRSRDFGATWLNADVGLFLGGAVSVAVNPRDSNHLLLGTDGNLLVSRAAGRDWKVDSSATLFGAVTALAFLPDGQSALCSTPGGIFRLDAGRWTPTDAPNGAFPARAISAGAAPDRFYLLGRRDLFRSDDGGRRWHRVEHTLAEQSELSELAVILQPAEILLAIIDGKLMASRSGGRDWTPQRSGLSDEKVEALSADPAVPGRLWIAQASRLYVSDDSGERWRTVGQPLPEPDTSVRAIAGDAQGRTLVITTHRGMYRSADAGKNWNLLEANLPVHLEAKPLVRDPGHAQTLYAGYSLLPYGEIWRIAVEGGNLLARVDTVSLAGGLAFLLLLALGGFFAARALSRRGTRAV
jgi:photosystem II stability/assembly factor-like uncharacterized protein